jgi:sugar O-acyltransferase (sialic acid O-acetyltransferase NeuD family)
MKKQLVIWGAGRIAQAVTFFFARDSDYEIVGYCCDGEFAVAGEYLGKPLVSKDEAVTRFPPTDCSMFVGLGYQGMNELRATVVAWAQNAGYTLASYRSPHVPGDYEMGKNSIVMDGAVIQPQVVIGDNVYVWGGSMIGHHARIGNHCWLTGSCAIGGIVTMQEKCFVGLNATVGNEIVIGARCMLGANTLINKSLNDDSVLVQGNTEIHRLNAGQFVRMSQCFRI